MTNSVPERGSVSIFAPNSRTGRKGGGWQKKGGGGDDVTLPKDLSHPAALQNATSSPSLCHPFTARTALCRKTAHFLATKPSSGTDRPRSNGASALSKPPTWAFAGEERPLRAKGRVRRARTRFGGQKSRVSPHGGRLRSPRGRATKGRAGMPARAARGRGGYPRRGRGRQWGGRPRRARGRGGRAARPRRGRERQQRGAGRGNPPFARSRFLWPYRPPILARKTSLLRTPCVRRAPKATTFNHQ